MTCPATIINLNKVKGFLELLALSLTKTGVILTNNKFLPSIHILYVLFCP